MARKVVISYLTGEGKYVRYEASDPVTDENMTAILQLMDGAELSELALNALGD